MLLEVRLLWYQIGHGPSSSFYNPCNIPQSPRRRMLQNKVRLLKSNYIFKSLYGLMFKNASTSLSVTWTHASDRYPVTSEGVSGLPGGCGARDLIASLCLKSSCIYSATVWENTSGSMLQYTVILYTRSDDIIRDGGIDKLIIGNCPLVIPFLLHLVCIREHGLILAHEVLDLSPKQWIQLI